MKMVMAASGALFVLYVLLHMYGNLHIFSGVKAFDEYAHSLRTMFTPILPFGGFLWLLRALLVLAVIAHLWAAAQLWRRANGARTTRYFAKEAAKAAVKSKMMRWGGVAIVLFVIWHLLQFTIVKFNVGPDQVGDSPGGLVISSFQVWWVTLIYVLAMIALAMHLWHGVFSASQTIGWSTTAEARARARATATVISLVTSIGFILPPLAILFGIVKGN
jgi:succinate dehydrogenase / fumarate reductase cytochrome b subunit